MTNCNPVTGIRYGVIAGQNVSGLLDDILTNGIDVTYAASKKEVIAEIVGLLNGDDEDALASFILDRSHHDQVASRALAKTYLADQDGETATETDAETVFDALNIGECQQSDENNYTYKDKAGNEFHLSYLGGASLIYCIKTDTIVHCKDLCSPCVPDAGDLDSGLTTPGIGYECYGVPSQYVPDGAT